jgi:hypothetical protein
MPVKLRPFPAFPFLPSFPIPTVPPPDKGLGSNSNYILYSECKLLTDLTVTIHLTQDMVWESSSGTTKGFSFQLNAYSPKGAISAWQQYVIILTDKKLQGAINNWPVTGDAIINERVNLLSKSDLRLPAEWELEISLRYDTNGVINGATYVVTDVGIPPMPVSALDGYVGVDGDQHVNFIGTDGHIHELFHPSGGDWIHNDLTMLSGGGVGPLTGSALDGYARSDGGQHVNFIGTDGHVHELHIQPDGSWENNDLTILSGGGITPAPGSSLDGYAGPDDGQHVNFIGTDGHVHELYLHSDAQWVNNDLIKLSGNGIGPAPGSALDGYVDSEPEFNRGQHVNFIGTDGHVHELYTHPGAQWVNNDLIKLSGNGVGPAAGSALDGYAGLDGKQHVNFIGTDGHVHELYIHPHAQWVNNDLTHLSGDGVVPAPGSALDGYWGPDDSQHVNFVGLDGHLRELYIHPDAQWVNNDLTVLSGNGVTPAADSALDGYLGEDDGQHVNFIGTDGHLHEMYIHPDAQWVNTDLNHFELANETQSLSSQPANHLAPITAFELNIVGPESGESSVLSSGAGTITYSATSALTVLNVEPACTESDYTTGETANTIYGPMDPGPSTILMQSFYVSTGMPMIHKKGPHPPGGTISTRPKSKRRR